MDEKTVSLLKGHIAKAKEKLHAADTLLKSGDHEDAVSRAYYTAFHAAQAVLLTEGLVPPLIKAWLICLGCIL